jgi:hypothetical protein
MPQARSWLFFSHYRRLVLINLNACMVLHFDNASWHVHWRNGLLLDALAGSLEPGEWLLVPAVPPQYDKEGFNCRSPYLLRLCTQRHARIHR